MAGRRAHSQRDRERGVRLAARLRDERGSRSRYEIAAASGVAPDTIKRIEDGRTLDPGFFTVAGLASVLGIGLDDLAGTALGDKR